MNSRSRADFSGLIATLMAVGVSACAMSEGAPSPLSGTAVTGSVAAGLVADRQPATDCAALEAAIDTDIKSLAGKLAHARSEASSAPATLEQAYKRLMGQAGSTAAEQSAQQRAAIDRENAEAAAKGCAPVNVDQRIGTVAAAPAAPVPVMAPTQVDATTFGRADKYSRF